MAFPLPEVVRDWPAPRGHKTRPAHWLHAAAEYRTFLQGVIEEHGEDALALIWQDSARRSNTHPTRWFCPGVPMHATGEQTEIAGRPFQGYLVPARAALLAAEVGLVTFHG